MDIKRMADTLNAEVREPTNQESSNSQNQPVPQQTQQTVIAPLPKSQIQISDVQMEQTTNTQSQSTDQQLSYSWGPPEYQTNTTTQQPPMTAQETQETGNIDI